MTQNTSSLTDAELDKEIALLDRRLGMISLERGLRQQRITAAVSHDNTTFDGISNILAVICNIEFGEDGQPFVKMDRIFDSVQDSLKHDSAFQQIINASLAEAIGKTIDFTTI